MPGDDAADDWSVVAQYDRYFQFVTANDPPRRGALWVQFRVDAECRTPKYLWLFGGSVISYGLFTGQANAVWMGAATFPADLLMLFNVSRSLRNRPLIIATVDSVTPHPSAS